MATVPLSFLVYNISGSLVGLKVKQVCLVLFARSILSTFNEIFGFPPSLDLLLRKVPCQFNRTCLELRYCGTIITTLVHTNVLLLGTLAFGWPSALWLVVFLLGKSVNVARLSELYFLSYMLECDCINLRYFIAWQLHSTVLVLRVGLSLGALLHLLLDV